MNVFYLLLVWVLSSCGEGVKEDLDHSSADATAKAKVYSCHMEKGGVKFGCLEYRDVQKDMLDGYQMSCEDHPNYGFFALKACSASFGNVGCKVKTATATIIFYNFEGLFQSCDEIIQR